MNERDKILLRYVCDGDMRRARQQAKLILENTTAKKDEHFRYEMLRKLETKSNFIELPANLQGILVAEDSAFFPNKKFLVRPHEEAVAKKVLRIYRAADKLAEIGLPYFSALLLHGESGCGKTELARYIAYKANLPFVYVRFSALVSSYLGSTQANIARIFDYVRREPCVLCFDEIDAVGMARGQRNDVGEMNRIVIALMQELDKLPNNVIIVGTTNRFDRLDPALIRRFPIQYEVQKLSPEEACALAEKIVGYAGIDVEPWKLWFTTVFPESVPAEGVRGRNSCVYHRKGGAEMIYTFHVGDYVRLERADGTSSKTLTGYVSSHQRLVSGHSFIFKWDDGTQTGWSGNIEDLPQNFTRIGKYDFAWLRAVRDCGYAEKDELDKMSSTKLLMMPEYLHEGDFVETVDGRVGYIKSICRCEKCRERGFYEPTVHFTDGEEDCITKYEAENSFKGYKRIGRWVNEKAVVQKPKEIFHCGSVWKSENGTMRYVPDTQVMQDKINELVDAVNELRKGRI